MISNNTIFIFTSTRADYGRQRWIIKDLQNYSNFDIFVLVGGTHLSEQYGYTIEEISKDDIKNIIKLPFLSGSLNASSLIASVGNGLTQVSEIFAKYEPNIIILLGDRYELFIGAVAALL